jgi:hypothetical protein
MSFSYNPYEHIELIKAEPKNNSFQWRWHCHGCGGDSDISFAEDHGNGPIIAHYYAHLMRSHNRYPNDFDGWSKY